jgi:threonyl-tRNA synthetase
MGRQWQLGTIQVDYNLPERFDLTYKGSDNELHRPVMIHRAPFGSKWIYSHFTRTHSRKFPTWLMPEQAIILSLSEKYEIYAKSFRFARKSRNSRPHRQQKRQLVRKLEMLKCKIPFMLIVGEEEKKRNHLSVVMDKKEKEISPLQ